MRWGWLFNRFEDPDLKLSPEQRRRALDASTRAMRDRLIVHTAVIVVPPVLLAFAGARAIDDWVAARLGITDTQAFLALIGVIGLAFWPWSAWVYGRMYARPYRRALREVGVNVCVGCGYPLEGLATIDKCPECGASAAADHSPGSVSSPTNTTGR